LFASVQLGKQALCTPDFKIQQRVHPLDPVLRLKEPALAIH